MRQGFQSLSYCRTVGSRDSPIDRDRTLDPDSPLQVDRPYPKIHRGFKSPSNSESRLKPTEGSNQTIADFSPL